MGKRLKVMVKEGKNLAVRDLRSSDPYVVLKFGPNVASTRVVKKNLNPVWNQEFIFPVMDDNHLLKLYVWDKDRWGRDDKMGKAEIDVRGVMEKDLNSDKVVSPCKENFLYKDSHIVQRQDGGKVQEACLQLRNVESGFLTIQLEWPL
ncbi:hypothetical protein SUGI_0331070 [Cryptomeria japonica]|uniref:protein C2-DOMAIN ABA-RELATED 3-like n=1 Tax=Cryptomeria japonica TaxID=3369 RepID=UPI002408E3D1|nr:protein C2-DOMAIN ABA-RELATED 3-like [Cryptomeria japonica]GLJ18590.1 hypothetical protein SUGI_0331070 [Cryptomeria japonica]